jgi:hypothetical protein
MQGVVASSCSAGFAKSFHIPQCFAVLGSLCLMVGDGSCTYDKEMKMFLSLGVCSSAVGDPAGSSK